jgi:hypothetical protein
LLRSGDKGRGSGSLITLGAITIGTLGILAYAKKDPEVRTALEEWIPGTDKIIQFVFREESSSSYFDFIFTFFETLKERYENQLHKILAIFDSYRFNKAMIIILQATRRIPQRIDARTRSDTEKNRIHKTHRIHT